MPNKSITLKVGAAFAPHLTYTQQNDTVPATLENVTITSQVRTPEGDLIADLTATVDDDYMGVTLTAADGTDNWPAGVTLEWDVRFAPADGPVFYSDTADIKTRRSATKVE